MFHIAQVSCFCRIADTEPQSGVTALTINWAELVPRTKEAVEDMSIALSSAQLRLSVPKPGQLVYAAMNYYYNSEEEVARFCAAIAAQA